MKGGMLLLLLLMVGLSSQTTIKRQAEEENEEECGLTMFTCTKQHQCVPDRYLCDGEPDCADKTDEIGCDDSSFEQEGPISLMASSTTLTTSTAPTSTTSRGARTSTVPKAFVEHEQCDSHEFTCKVQHQCILLHFQCDGEADCIDKTDEQNCNEDDKYHVWPTASTDATPARRATLRSPVLTCDSLDFTCTVQHQCISDRYRCDGDTDCTDGTDEMNCGENDPTSADQSELSSFIPDEESCSETHFQCGGFPMHCILKEFACDGHVDCEDESDEAECGKISTAASPSTAEPPVRCTISQFKCKTVNKCIPDEFLCDGAEDCGDSSDEVDCPYRTTTYRS